MTCKSTEMEARSDRRMSSTAFVLLILEACGKLELNEEILHSLAYLAQSQMPEECYPEMNWAIRANFIHSEEIRHGLKLARNQGLLEHEPLVKLTATGKSHCSLLNVSHR